MVAQAEADPKTDQQLYGPFELLVGSHFEGIEPDGQPKQYRQGDIFHSRSNLLKFNSPGSIKFRRANAPDRYFAEPEPVQAHEEPRDELAGMTVEQLKDFASGQDIELGKARTKDELVRAIRQALDG